MEGWTKVTNCQPIKLKTKLVISPTQVKFDIMYCMIMVLTSVYCIHAGHLESKADIFQIKFKNSSW